MKIVKWSILALSAMSFLSCVASLLPLFEDSYLVAEPGLIGTWKAAEGADTWTFEKAGGNEYLLVQKQAQFDLDHVGGQPSKKVPGDAARFRARLGSLGGNLFLDLYPADEDNPTAHNDLLNAHLIPAHTLARVWLAKDSLKIIFLDEDWISKAIDTGEIKLTHVNSGQWLVLTAPTAELQAFILKFGGNAKAFPLSGAEELRRVK